MTKALNWRRAQIAPKRKTSIADEQEWRGKDAAARWLERNEKLPKVKRRPPFKSARATAPSEGAAA